MRHLISLFVSLLVSLVISKDVVALDLVTKSFKMYCTVFNDLTNAQVVRGVIVSPDTESKEVIVRPPASEGWLKDRIVSSLKRKTPLMILCASHPDDGVTGGWLHGYFSETISDEIFKEILNKDTPLASGGWSIFSYNQTMTVPTPWKTTQAGVLYVWTSFKDNPIEKVPFNFSIANCEADWAGPTRVMGSPGRMLEVTDAGIFKVSGSDGKYTITGLPFEISEMRERLRPTTSAISGAKKEAYVGSENTPFVYWFKDHSSCAVFAYATRDGRFSSSAFADLTAILWDMYQNHRKDFEKLVAIYLQSSP